MSNLETYDRIFMEIFEVPAEALPGLKYQDTASWDSVGHMTMIAELEEAFDLMMETDDIIDFSSYEKGREILKKYDVEI
ncbi:MAG: acyl carrier protein [Candidatus Adiutrix sp.]|jgi:acyl carrier protein|nr:acyl carrier protein [Candidatus Adiutrix sp.]